jgi:hypothetical protein
MAAMLGALIGVGMVGLHPALAEDDPNAIPYLFAHAGGPYYGKVGVPIEFNASTSYIGDGSTIEGYHWDWDMDKNYECVTLPICTHTWHSAFAGEVWMQVFGPGDNMAWDTARVTVTGPETFLTFTLSSAFADLHVYDPKGRHVGLNYASGAVDQRSRGRPTSGRLSSPRRTRRLRHRRSRCPSTRGRLSRSNSWARPTIPFS